MLGQVVADERRTSAYLPSRRARQGRDIDDGLHVAVAATCAAALIRHVLDSVARGHVPQGSQSVLGAREPSRARDRLRTHGLQLLDRRRPEERHLDAVRDDQPAPPRVPTAAQGSALLQRRGLRLGPPRLRARLHRAPSRPRPHDGRRLDPGLPVLAPRPRAHARLQPGPAADRGVPRPDRAVVLALDDAAHPPSRLARLAGVPHRVPPDLAAHDGADRREADALQAHVRHRPRLLRRAAGARLLGLRPIDSGCCWSSGRCSRRFNPAGRPGDRPPRTAALREAPAAAQPLRRGVARHRHRPDRRGPVVTRVAVRRTTWPSSTSSPASTPPSGRRPGSSPGPSTRASSRRGWPRRSLYADDLAVFDQLSGLDTSDWPTTRILAGTLDPAELAAKLATKVAPG